MFNKVILVGNLTRDIEMKQAGAGVVGKTGLAVTRKYSANGEKREETMFIDLVFWGRSAETAAQYLHKGSKVLIEGRLRLEQWQTQNGETRSKHSVSVENMEMLDTKPANANYTSAKDYARTMNERMREPLPPAPDERDERAQKREEKYDLELSDDGETIPF